jgi:tryptophanyl-tRNA synthetase
MVQSSASIGRPPVAERPGAAGHPAHGVGYTRPTMTSPAQPSTAPATAEAAATPMRTFSGIQPSGVAHLGNDLGAIRNYVRLQDEYEAIYCIVDYHALTSTHDPDVLRARTRDMAASLLALGLDPGRCTLFVQSHRPEHTELCWLLSTVTPVSWLERTPTYKEKIQQQPDDVNHGLLTYPVLQAADIVMYKASLVPVGRDQAAHLEVSREIVRAFNRRYGETFPEPQAVFTEAPTVLGTDGVKKMSKSVGNTIDILAEPELIRKQVMSMVTDTQRILRTDPGRPEVCNVCQLHRFFGLDFLEIQDGERTARTGCVDTKKLLADRIIRQYAPARERYLELQAHPEQVAGVLEAGADRLRPMAAATLDEVREKMGLR